MTDEKIASERVWEEGWDGHEKAQLKRLASLTFQEKIIWLEKAQEMLKGLNRPSEIKAKYVSRDKRRRQER